MKITGMFLVPVLLAAGCASTPAENADPTANPVAAVPTFTEEEKAQMSSEEKVAIYNESTEKIQDKVVCRRQVITGSHRKKMVCRTVGQIKREQDEAAESLRDTMKGGTFGGGGGDGGDAGAAGGG